MLSCARVLTLVERFVTVLIKIVETIVETVCELVVTIVRTVVEVTKKVCKWLPWPLDKLCDFVTELVEKVTEVVEWVCEEVILRIIRWVEVVVRYVFWVFRWVCWIVDWGLRLIALAACMLGVKNRKSMVLCVKVLVDADGAPALPIDDVKEMVEATRERFEQCAIDVCLHSIELVSAPADIEEFRCDPGGFFSSHHLFFVEESCSPEHAGAIPITAFFVPEYEGAKGCAIPRTDYVVMGSNASLATLAHELGHHADLLHHDDPTNVMVNGTTDAAVNFTKWQCCMIRTARYTSSRTLPACDRGSVDLGLAAERLVRPVPPGGLR